jgi:sugar phosphate isomerase/epimerase
MNAAEFSRRKFLAMSAGVPALLSAAGVAELYAADIKIPVGLELFSVREGLKQDPDNTLRAVAKMGYECVEFYSPYFEWTEAQAKEKRKLLDDVGMKCYSTHNTAAYFGKENLSRARDLNLILGTKYLVLATPDAKKSLDEWTAVAELLDSTAEQLKPAGLKTGYHNHATEFIPINGIRPMEILAGKTKPTVMLQLDVGTCIEAGSDPVAWIKANPGRIRSIHCKDWSAQPKKGYEVLFGEGDANWPAIFSAAENGGGIEFYLVEQEGSRFSELETAEKCLETFRTLHKS